MASDLTGLEVTHDFDLDVPYYPRTPWTDCKRLCLSTPGCRSASFFGGEELCVLKRATCVEAGTGVGCLQRHASSTYFMHADRAVASGFIAGPSQHSLHYQAVLERPGGNYSTGLAACAELGGRPASIHTPDALRSLVKEALRVASQQPQLADPDGTLLLWPFGTFSAETNVTWYDGTRFQLYNSSAETALSVLSSEGCVAIQATNSSGHLVVVPCERRGFPLCSFFAPGHYGIYVQSASSLSLMFADQMGSGDADNFCAAKGGLSYAPRAGVQGRNTIMEISSYMGADVWVGGYTRNTSDAKSFFYNTGEPIPGEFLTKSLASFGGPHCVSQYGGTRAGSWFYPMSCDVNRWVTCSWSPPPSGNDLDWQGEPAIQPDGQSRRMLPARVRFWRGAALLFITSSKTHGGAEAECAAFPGGHLVSIHDAATEAVVINTWVELDPLSNNFRLLGAAQRVLSYIGASNAGNTDGQLKWTDGSSFNYTSNLGSTTLSTLSCITLTSRGPEGPVRWDSTNQNDCLTKARNFTCRVAYQGVFKPSAALVSGTSLFELHLKVPMVFSDAQEACKTRGGNLASPTFSRQFEDLKKFIYRLRHEMPYTTTLPEYWEMWVGATTNKTDASLVWTDFSWVDGSRPFDWPMWYNAFPIGSPVDFAMFDGAPSAGVLTPPIGIPTFVRRRANLSRPFLCETPIAEPLPSQTLTDGHMTYEVVTTPQSLPYHAAELVCQARGGHLAGVSTAQQLQLVSQLCAQALGALPRASAGGFESHDVSSGCWVGLYCPAGYNADVSHVDGFGEHPLQLLAGFQPGILGARACNASSDLLWLDSRSTADAMAAGVETAGAALSATARCGMLVPSGNGSTGGALTTGPCKQFAAFVCGRGGAPAQPRPNLTAQPKAAVADSADSIPEGAVQQYGCFAMAASAQTAGGLNGSSSLAQRPTPLPVLLSAGASLAECYALARAANLSFYSLVGSGSATCWGGWEAPAVPFVNVSDPACCGPAASQLPACGSASTVYALAGASPGLPASATASQPYICMSDQQLGAANAVLVGQKHISASQLHHCEDLCNALGPTCDLYTYDMRARACLLLSVPDTPSLASLPVYDTMWAPATCVKAARLVAGAEAIPSSSAEGPLPAGSVCGADLGARLLTAGQVALSPLNDLPAANLSACAASCAANATCQGFAVFRRAPGAELLCATRSALLVDRARDWLADRPWVLLPDAPTAASSPAVVDAQGCLNLERLVPPQAFVCADDDDTAGWELERLNGTDEAGCRAVCEADRDCALYVYYSGLQVCSIRFRVFYDTKQLPQVVGTNGRPDASLPGTARSCLHTLRLLQPLASPAKGFVNRRYPIGGAQHLCVPKMDARGFDVFVVDTFKDIVCGEACVRRPDCDYYITTSDYPELGSCYAKSAVVPFTVGDNKEFPGTGGNTRYDLNGVLESCYNLERQIPRFTPVYTCAEQYGVAFVVKAQNVTATAFACEALCDASAWCAAYTWMAHNSSCVLGGGAASSAWNLAPAVPASGPSWLASQTCLRLDRLLGPSPVPMQTNRAWHHCAVGRALTVPSAASGGPDLLRATNFAVAINIGNNFTAVRLCSQQCDLYESCHMFVLSWRNATDVWPTCLLLGWGSSAPVTPPATAGDPAAPADSVSLTCLSMMTDTAFPTVAGWLAHPRPTPAAVQAYRSKQYSVYLDTVSYSLASGICQAAGGQLLSVNSRQELSVLAALLRPYSQWLMQPSALAAPQAPSFWTGLLWTNGSAGSSCSGWCHSHGRSTNASFVQSLAAAAGSIDAGCGVLNTRPGGGSIGLAPSACSGPALPFVCETTSPAVQQYSTSSGVPVQVFAALASFDAVVRLAQAAGAVLAVVEVSNSNSSSQRRARALQQSSSGDAVRFPNVSSAAAACGSAQLRASGCWLQLVPPADACSATPASPLCNTSSLLVVDAASPSAAAAQSLGALMAPGSSPCAMARVQGAGAPTFAPVPCSTAAAFLAAVVDPDAPFRNSVLASPPPSLPPPPSPAPPLSDVRSAPTMETSGDSGLSDGAIAGIVVGSVVGGLLLVALLAGAILYARWKPTADSSGRPSDIEDPVKAHEKALRVDDKGDGNGDAHSSGIGAHSGVGAESVALTFSGQPTTASNTESYSLKTLGLHSSGPFIKPGAGMLVPDSELSADTPSRCSAPNTLVVTQEDPDVDDVSWQIDPRLDVTWDEADELGKGTFGVVYRGTYKGIPVAIKTVLRCPKEGDFDMQSLKALLHEARILSKVRHPNIVTCYGGCITDTNVFIVEELMSRTVGQLISSSNGPLPLETVLRIGIDVANGLFQLHPTIVHRDLKPDNVLLDGAGRAKISDFGLARFKVQSYLVSTKNFAAGTLPFMAPEVFRDKLHGISEKADIFSLAVVLWSMITGQAQPWGEYHYAAIVYKVSIAGERLPLPEDPVKCPPRLASLIQRMWAQEPGSRPGAGEVLKQLSVMLREVGRSTSGASGQRSAGSVGSAPQSRATSGAPVSADSAGREGRAQDGTSDADKSL
ncbi:hypothetical protein HYH03_012143 [Edaphochlamys debaryana]|uniref:Uncharacterized protein n=1 Tax=Edaphochlamys debaryana TaxID=47281 RepID=A0A836BU95_9CHLO|nr:hypothetical protein HYH03_012143 [Edaphochlamys debaryana]|eukprot:KAG2489311.1 hypothetical protein HYH03_012143 [Edaphochlamys debaryana]